MEKQIFKVYKSLNEYAQLQGIHLQTARKRLDSGKIIEVWRVEKRIGYIEVIESIQFLSKLL